MTYLNVFVGTDGSSTAACAVEAAIELAQRTGATLHIATAWHPDLADASIGEQMEADRASGSHWPERTSRHEAMWASDVATDAAAVARARGLEDVRQLTPKGGPAEVLMDLGESKPDSLIVVGTQGLTDRTERVLGNIPHSLTHHARSDVLLVDTGDCSAGYDWSTVALATDGSETAAIAVAHGLALAEALEAEPTLLTVAHDDARGNELLDRVAANLEKGDGIGRRVLAGRDVSQAIIDAAADFDLLVLGNKGMSGPSRLLGSVSNPVTHLCPTDLLLVNTTKR